MPLVILQSKPVLGVCITLIRSQSIPTHSLLMILQNALSGYIEKAEISLCACEPLFSGKTIETEGLLQVQINPLTGVPLVYRP